MDILLLPMSMLGVVFITAPFAAFLVAAVFVWLYFRKRQRLVLLAAILWAVYGLYEYGMYLRVLCTGECNIRVDLLLVYPLLVLLSLVALVLYLAGRPRR